MADHEFTQEDREIVELFVAASVALGRALALSFGVTPVSRIDEAWTDLAEEVCWAAIKTETM